MSAWAERLAVLPAGSHVSFSYTALPEAVILDLAIQAAGLVPVPVSAPVPEGWGERFDLDPPAPGPLFHQSPGEGAMPDWAAMAERVQAEIGAPPKRTREIVVLSGPLDRPEERAMLSWATVAGAAVVLEPNPALRVATAAWVRPTVFHGTAEEVAALRGWVEKEGKGWFRERVRLPFRRLRRVLAVGEIGAEEKEFWEGRGAAVSGIAAERRNRGI